MPPKKNKKKGTGSHLGWTEEEAEKDTAAHEMLEIYHCHIAADLLAPQRFLAKFECVLLVAFACFSAWVHVRACVGIFA